MKIVEVEFNIDAREDTIAAVRAAKAKPLIPAGTKLCNSHGYASSGGLIADGSPLVSTKAAIPGITTIKGIINLR